MIGKFFLFAASVFFFARLFSHLIKAQRANASGQGQGLFCAFILVLLSIASIVLNILLPTFVFFVIFIVLALPIALFFFNAEKKDSAVRTEINLLMILSMCVSVCMLETSFRADDSVEATIADEIFYSRLSGETLCEYLAEKCRNAKVLIVAQPKQLQPKTTAAAIQGFIDAAAAGKPLDIRGIDFPGSPPPDAKPGELNAELKISPERMISIEKNLTAELFDELVSRYPECNLLVFFMSLPKNPEDMESLVMENGEARKIALLKSNLKGLAEAIRSQTIVAAVASKPDFFKDKDISEHKKALENKQEAFKERFLLVTPENVAEIEAAYPQIF